MGGMRAQWSGGSGEATDVIVGICGGCGRPYTISDGLLHMAIGVSIGVGTIGLWHGGRHLD